MPKNIKRNKSSGVSKAKVKKSKRNLTLKLS